MPPAKKIPTPRQRRTQAERSDAMRERLLKATLASLLEDGYAATSVSSIVKRARVSRGAHLHHYASKEALLNDAAEYLMRDAYRRLGRVLLDTAHSGQRLETLLVHMWSDLLSAPLNQVYNELLLASRRDKSLERVLRQLSAAALQPMKLAARHFFESADPAIEDVNVAFLLNQWLMRGMALDLSLVGDPAKFEHCLAVWRHMLANHIKPRDDVRDLPTRPSNWDLHWPDLLRAPAAEASAQRADSAPAKPSSRARATAGESGASKRKPDKARAVRRTAAPRGWEPPSP